MKVVITGTGSGGRVYPALSVVEKMKEMDPTITITYTGVRDSIEEAMVKRANLKFFAYEPIQETAGLVRSVAIKISNTLKIARFLLRFQPSYILSTGGGASSSVLRAALLTRTPFLIHEQNAVPSKTTMFFSRFAKIIFVSFPESVKYFKVPKRKIIISGNPIRSVFSELNRDLVRKQKGFSDKKLILSYGGTEGSQIMNEFATHAEEVLRGHDDFVWVHVTGRKYYKTCVDRFPKLPNFRVYDYLNSMPEYIASSDIIIARSGANTLTEISTFGIPAILVPDPTVANDHQTKNAELYSANDAAFLIEESAIEHDYMFKVLKNLINDSSLREKMAARSKQIGLMGGANLIAQYILFGSE